MGIVVWVLRRDCCREDIGSRVVGTMRGPALVLDVGVGHRWLCNRFRKIGWRLSRTEKPLAVASDKNGWKGHHLGLVR